MNRPKPESTTSGYVLSRIEEAQLLKNIRVTKATPIADIQFGGKAYYVIYGNSNACEVCLKKHGIAYHISSAVVGETYPPFHPNCKCDVRPHDGIDFIAAGGGQFTPFENPDFGPTPNDWMFFGRDGDEFNETPEELYTDEYFGKPIPVESQPQSEVEMHIVDRIARTLYSEHTYSYESQSAIIWSMLNRSVFGGYN